MILVPASRLDFYYGLSFDFGNHRFMICTYLSKFCDLKTVYYLHNYVFCDKYVGLSHGLRTPNEGINQRYLKNWADVAYKICFGRTYKFGSGSEFSAAQWRLFPFWASVVRVLNHLQFHSVVPFDDCTLKIEITTP